MRHQPVVKRSRALGIALSEKAAARMERRPYPPGAHGRTRRTNSEYSMQLREKQRLKAQYHVSEKQLAKVYEVATKRPGLTGHLMIEDLETRLDALVLRAGLARSVYQARQLVSHGHILLDGRKADIPSMRVAPGQTITVKAKSHAMPAMVAAKEYGGSVPRYLHVDRDTLTIQLLEAPKRDQVPIVCDERLVVEHYSR